MVTEKGRNTGIDLMRLIAALMVVAIQTYPLASLSETGDFLVTRVLCRVAVPFFFMVTGYYVLPGCLKKGKGSRKLAGWFRKTSLLYGAAVLIYLPVNLYAGRLEGLTAGAVLRELLWNGTFYHLWYFPAALLGMGLTVFLIRRLGMRKTVFAVLILYVAGLLGDSYYGVAVQAAPLKAFYEWLWQWMDYTRTGLFFAPVFLCLGLVLRKQKPLSGKQSGIGTGICLGLMLAEGIVLHRFSLQRHDSMYLLLLPAMYFLFSWVRTWRVPAFPKACQMSALIYLIHPLCIIAVRGIGGALDLRWLLVDNSLVHFAAVAVSAAVLSAVPGILHRRKEALSDGEK